jgi:NTP pyrophosphatase (non-canonical NTP hydrolase)
LSQFLKEHNYELSDKECFQVFLTNILEPNNKRKMEKTTEITLQQAQEIVDDWIKTNGVRYFNELTNLGVLVEEVGEMSRHMVRIYGEQSYKKEAAPQGKEALADEMADVLFVLICLANQTGINLTEALQKNLDKKTKRDANRHKENKKLSNE